MRGKRHLAVAVLSSALLLGSSSVTVTPQTSAQQLQVGQPVVVTVAALNGRAAPTVTSPVVTVLAQNEVVRVVSAATVAEGYNWYQIERAGVVVGWSVQGFIPGTAPSWPTTPTAPSGAYPYGTSVTVTASLLNVRSLPSINAPILTVYANGRVATVTGEARIADNITWYPVDNTGWVSGEYLRAGSTTPPTPTTPTAPPSTGATTVWSVNVDQLNIRATPGTSGTIVRTVPYGTRLTQTGDGVTVDGFLWFPVDNLGWVSGRFLVLEQEELYVTAGVLNVRSTPSTSGTIVSTLSYGQTVNVFANARDASGELWYAIDAAGTQWVSGRYISIRLPGQ